MNWEALFVIGTLALVLGVVLSLPARYLTRRLLRNTQPGSPLCLRMTPTGIAFSLVVVGVLLAGSAWESVAPHSPLGSLVSTNRGKLVFMVLVAACAVVAETVMLRLGFTIARRDERDG